MTRVYFVRHAQSDYRSGTDRDRGLTAEAWEDVKIVLEFLRDKRVDVSASAKRSPAATAGSYSAGAGRTSTGMNPAARRSAARKPAILKP